MHDGQLSSPLLSYNPGSWDFPARVHVVYDALRQEAPLVWAPAVGEWVATRHAEVREIIRDPSLKPVDLAGLVANTTREAGAPVPALLRLVEAVLFLESPPGHAVARRHLSRVLNARPLADLAPLIESLTTEHLTALRAAGGGDFIKGFASAIPSRLMAHLLGLPDEDLAFLAESSSEVAQVLLSRRCPAPAYAAANARVAAALDHLGDLCRERRQRPRGDGLSRLVELSVGEDRLPDRVLAAHAYFLFIVGIETTVSFLAKSVHALLRHEGELRRWRDGAVAPAGAVEELLRFTSPVSIVMRQVEGERVLFGRRLAAGHLVTAVLEAANRDPAVFADPHRLDLRRSPCPHLAFSDGPHLCLGAALARLEGRIALGALVITPGIQLVAEPRVANFDFLSQLASLDLRFAGG